MNKQQGPQQIERSRESLKDRSRVLLPWHEPRRQAVTTGWWGWFPNIPRRRFGRLCWVTVVASLSCAFAVLALLLLVSAFTGQLGGGSWWGIALAFVLCLFGCLLFAWHLIAGIALAQLEDARLRELREEAARAAEQVEQARRRLKQN